MTTQYLDLDRLGLSPGSHEFKLFYAQRQPTSATLRLRTNLVLANAAPATISGAFD